MSNTVQPLSVCFIFRKKDPIFFSIEKVFSVLIPAMQPYIDTRVQSLPHYSSSVANIAANIRAAKKCRAAIYHITGDIHYAVFGLPGKRTVLTIHDCIFLQQATGLKKQIFKWIWLSWPVRFAGIVTTISEKSKAEIIKHTGCKPEKIVVIPNPVSGHIGYTRKEFNKAQPLILFIGSTPNKNLLRVIPAMDGISAELHIIGEIPDEAMQLLKEHQIRFRQSLRLSDQELAACYADADLVLFPSTYEGFGLPILEAQKTGRPVITSDLSPMKEVAGEAACLVDPYAIDSIRTAILRVTADDDYREQLMEKGLENVKRYDAAALADQYLACYKKLTP